VKLYTLQTMYVYSTQYTFGLPVNHLWFTFGNRLFYGDQGKLLGGHSAGAGGFLPQQPGKGGRGTPDRAEFWLGESFWSFLGDYGGAG